MPKKSMEHKHEDHSVEKTEAFEEQQGIMQKIAETGFSEYAETLPGLSDAFNLEKHKVAENLHRCACCMDGRTPYGVHSAGSGMLLSETEFEKFFRDSRADSISSHTGCGAAKLYADKMGLTGDPDQIAKEWAKKKAGQMKVPYIHLEVEKPFHSERVCYYDGTGRFNYKGVEGLPQGFVIGRKYMSKDASLAECNVEKNIIFGDHGFGKELLTKENPFLFVAVADTEEEMQKLKKELEGLVKAFGDSVGVDGFVAPK